MSNKILISFGKVKIEAVLLDTPTARNIKDSLPFGSKANIIGAQAYFETPVMAETEDDARDVINAGELGFWADSGIVVIGFGKTAASEGEEVRLTARANIWANAITDVTLIKSMKPDDFVFIETLE